MPATLSKARRPERGVCVSQPSYLGLFGKYYHLIMFGSWRVTSFLRYAALSLVTLLLLLSLLLLADFTSGKETSIAN